MATETLSCRITRALGRILSRWGVDADQYHSLLQASLRMDFRSRSSLSGTAHQTNRTKSALIMTGIMYMIFSLLLAASLRMAEVGTFFFTVVIFGYAMAMMALSILIEFGMVVISPDDFLILAHRPISSRTFFAVKFSNLLFYTLLIDLSLNLAPALLGWTFNDAPWQFPLVYLPVATLGGVFVAAVVVAIYGLLLQRINYERFKDLLAWCQILFSFLFFFGYQLIPRVIGRVHGFHMEHIPTGAAALPPVWFASLTELGLGHFSWPMLGLAGIGVAATLFLLPGLLHSVSLDYSDRIGGIVTAAVKRAAPNKRKTGESFAPGVERWLAFNQEERALLGFLLKMLRRNRLLKLQLYPNFGVVIALFAVGVMDHDSLNDPLVGGKMGVATIFPLMAFLFAAMGFTASLPYSNEYEGGWIFYTAPIAHPECFLKAIKKALFLVLFVPLFILNVVLYALFWPLAHAVAMSLYGLAIGIATFQATLFWFKSFPFSRKPEKGAQSRRMAIVFVMMIAYGVFMALPGLFASLPGLFPAIVAILFGVGLLLGHWNNRAYANAVRQLEFGEEN